MNQIYPDKTLYVFIGSPRTGSESIARALKHIPESLREVHGVFSHPELDSSRHPKIVDQLLGLSSTDSERVSREVLTAFAASSSLMCCVSDETASMRLTSAAELSRRKTELKTEFGLRLVLVMYVRSPMSRYPSWVLHKNSASRNSGSSPPDIQEYRIRRTLAAVQFAEVDYILRVYDEIHFDVVQDVAINVLKIPLSTFADRRSNLLKSPEFLLAAITILNHEDCKFRIVSELAEACHKAAIKVSRPLPILHESIQADLIFQTIKLNWYLQKLSGKQFEVPKVRRKKSGFFEGKSLRIQDVFKVNNSKVKYYENLIAEIALYK